MHVREFKDARDAVKALRTSYEIVGIGDRTPRFVHWTPGDATKYMVALLEMRPIGDSRPASRLTMLFVSCNGKQIFLRKPQSTWLQYSAEHFLRVHGEDYAGWWSGLRPLLAALEWTTERDRYTAYDANDATRIGELLQRH